MTKFAFLETGSMSRYINPCQMRTFLTHPIAGFDFCLRSHNPQVASSERLILLLSTPSVLLKKTQPDFYQDSRIPIWRRNTSAYSGSSMDCASIIKLGEDSRSATAGLSSSLSGSLASCPTGSALFCSSGNKCRGDTVNRSVGVSGIRGTVVVMYQRMLIKFL